MATLFKWAMYASLTTNFSAFQKSIPNIETRCVFSISVHLLVLNCINMYLSRHTYPGTAIQVHLVIRTNQAVIKESLNCNLTEVAYAYCST